MTPEKIVEAFAGCRALLPSELHGVRGSKDWREHLIFMCNEGATYATDRREKAMRWLGFVQGALWAQGAASIPYLKDMNRPDEKPCTGTLVHDEFTSCPRHD